MVYADRALVANAVTKINDGDVLLTYAYSHVVLETFLAAKLQGREFHVIVIDARCRVPRVFRLSSCPPCGCGCPVLVSILRSGPSPPFLLCLS